ncbi:MAG: hypothetical protein HEP71_30900 [Roseivirga sp.]|nr:hypothetical protein [Roseivirga sp.]
MGNRLREFQLAGGGSSGGSSPQFSIEGWDKFTEAMKRIPQEHKRVVLLRVLRRSTKHAIRSIRAELRQHDDDGDLWDSVGNITGKSKTFPNVLVGYRVRGRYKGYHGHLIEHGTKQRFRRRKNTKASQVFGRRGRKAISTGRMPAFNIIKKAAAASQAQSIQLLEEEVARQTETILAKLFK